MDLEDLIHFDNQRLEFSKNHLHFLKTPTRYPTPQEKGETHLHQIE